MSKFNIEEEASKAIVDRSNEGTHDDASITVTLSCGHVERFWLMGLSDIEYIDRTMQLKQISNELRSHHGTTTIDIRTAVHAKKI